MSFSHPKVAPSRWDQKPLYRVVGGSSCICSEDEFLHITIPLSFFTSSRSPQTLIWALLTSDICDFPSHPICQGFHSSDETALKLQRQAKCSLKSQQSSAVAVTWSFIGQKNEDCLYIRISHWRSIRFPMKHQLAPIDVGSSLAWCGYPEVSLFPPAGFFFWVFIALFGDYLVKKKRFQEMSSCAMCCTDVSWGNRCQEQEKPEDEWISEFKIGNSLKFLWGET